MQTTLKGRESVSYMDNFTIGNYYYYYFGVRCARPGESEDTLSVQRPQPHTTNPWKEEKDKTVGEKRERANHANRKALALLLKPA